MKNQFALNLCFLLMLLNSLSGQNITRPNISGPGGLEVNAFTGNLFYQRQDMMIPGQGLPLEIAFSFNNQCRNTDRGYGLGWTFAYHMLYEITENLDVVIERMDGRRDTFQRVSGNYVAPAGIFDELTEYQAAKFRLRTKSGMQYKFDDPTHKRLTSLMDRNNNTITLSYNGTEINTINDGNGRALTLNWQNKKLTGIMDSNFTPTRSWTFAYDPEGHLQQVTDPLGETESYHYGFDHQLASIVNKNGNEFLVHYTGSRAVKKIASCDSELEIRYNGDGLQTFLMETGQSGLQTTAYTFDAAGNLLREQGNCCGFDLSYEYDTDKNITRITNALGNAVTFTYDERGNRLTETDALGQTSTFTYDAAFNQLSSLTDRRGNTTNYTYDSNGNLLSVTMPLNLTQSFTYDAKGNVKTLTDGLGNITTFSYNGNGYLTAVAYPIGGESFSYDAVGNLLSTTDANGHTVSYTYDALNRLQSITDPLSNNRAFAFDANHNLTQLTDENSHVQTNAYDVLDRLIQVDIPVSSTAYDYDQIGNLTRITDGNGNATRFAYNDQNLLRQQTDAEQNSTYFTYDRAGNLLTRTDANGQATTYTYDALNRLVEKAYLGNTDHFVYDANGNLTISSNDQVTINYTYDSVNRMLAKTFVEWNKTISYTYDANGNRLTMTDPDNGVTTYTYDAMNRLTEIVNPSGASTSFTYDDAGRPTEQQNANGTRTMYTYDIADRLLSITHLDGGEAVLAAYSYTYDAKGNRLTMTEQGVGLHSYTYDDADRLLTVTYPDGQMESFTYDPVGNRLQLTRNGLTTIYSYDAADRLISSGNANYTFDNNGNLIRKEDADGITEYSYDGENRLTGVTLPDATIVNYAYDPFGNRLVKQYDGNEVKYILDGVNTLLELDVANATSVRYTTGFGYDSWLLQEREGNAYTYHKDVLGSITGLSDGSGTLSNTYDYFAYGQVRDQSETVANTLTYTGREWDGESGLMYYRARYYDTEAGRFITKDSFDGFLGEPLSLNKYCYTENNPIIKVDPTGRFALTLLDIGLNVYQETKSQLSQNGGNVRCLDFVPIGIAAAFGALPLGVGFGTLGTGLKLLGKAAGRLGKTLKSGGRAVKHDDAAIFQDAGGILGDVVTQPIGDFLQDQAKKSINLEYKPFCNDPGNQGSQAGLQPNSEAEASCTVAVGGFDPNEIKGPAGFGAERWVSRDGVLAYTIYFENDPDSATAAAQLVSVTQDIDVNLDPQSFRLGSFGFGPFEFEVPANSTHYQARLDVADSLGVVVDVDAGIDYANRQLYWNFYSIDPVTGYFTLDPFAGFLPINDSTGRGEGFVNYTIQPLESTLTYDSIRAQAAIVFDVNAPVITNREVNLIDADQPMSEVLTVRNAIDTGHLLVEFTGTDIGAGVQQYDIYVRQATGPFVKWVGPVAGPYAILLANLGQDYCLISVAADSVLNLEDLPLDCQTAVTFTTDLLDDCPNAENWTFDQDPIQKGTYRAAATIESSGVVEKNSEVHFRAGERISMLPGFKVKAGSNFSARIANCEVPELELAPLPGQITWEKPEPSSVPFILTLSPNPANEEVQLRFSMEKDGRGSLWLVGLTGEILGNPIRNQMFTAGHHQQSFNVSAFPPGFYVWIWRVNGRQMVQKMVIAR